MDVLLTLSCSAPIITLEVTDTLKQPPAAAGSMKKSLRWGLGSCLVLFGLGGVLGYLALGDAVGGSFLLAFQDTAPAWVLILGSLMVVLNMMSAYQVKISSVPAPQLHKAWHAAACMHKRMSVAGHIVAQKTSPACCTEQRLGRCIPRGIRSC